MRLIFFLVVVVCDVIVLEDIVINFVGVGYGVVVREGFLREVMF